MLLLLLHDTHVAIGTVVAVLVVVTCAVGSVVAATLLSVRLLSPLSVFDASLKPFL